MDFLNPALVAGPLIATMIALPILIHLINLMRYRRVQWAAMEFLFAAHKKSSTWVLLKQLLLLLLRILALLALLLILAQMLYNTDLTSILGGVTTHHIVIVDDTFSMNDESVGEDTPLGTAREECLKIGELAAKSPGRKTFTLITYSQAKSKEFLFNQRKVDREEFPNTLASVVRRIQPTEMSISPQEALGALDALDRPENEKRRIYILSDFRAREWGSADELNARFKAMGDEGAIVNLVQCARSEHDNLTITELKPRVGAIATGISIVMDVAVTNHGKSAKNNVSISRLVDGKTLTPITITRILPGKTERRTFEVTFERAGMHKVTAQLQTEDSIAADNLRHTALEVQEGIPVLIVDGILATGETRGSDSFFLSTALKPGEFQTGIVPEIVEPQFLGRSGTNLDKYQGVILCNFDRLSETAIERLEAYVKRGGGLSIFAGERFNPRFITSRLYDDGKGLYPVPLAAEYDLIDTASDNAPDIDPDVTHPMFRVFGGQGGKFLREISLWRYYAVAKDWEPEAKSTVKIVARLRNRAPLVVEHIPFEGGGRVMAFLTTAGPIWNDWGRHLTYLVGVQELRNYLAPPPLDFSKPLGAKVGTEDAEQLSPDFYAEGYRWLSTGAEVSGKMNTDMKTGKYVFPMPEVTHSGIYTLQLTTRDQKTDLRTYVFNVVPEEGDLKMVGSEKLDTLYEADSVNILEPGAIGGQIDDSTRSNLSKYLLYALIFLLVFEQMLAYSASYHPPSIKGVA